MKNLFRTVSLLVALLTLFVCLSSCGGSPTVTTSDGIVSTKPTTAAEPEATEAGTEAMTEASAEATEAATVAATEPATESTEAGTEAMTGAMTNAATEAATEAVEPPNGNYTAVISNYDDRNYSVVLTDYMIEDPENPGRLIPGKAVTRLGSKTYEDLRDMDGGLLPNNLDRIDGEHNGENYVAYTCYLVNNGEKTLTYEYNLFIVNATRDADKAARVRLYVNGEETTYAQPDYQGNPEEGTEAFLSQGIIVRKHMNEFRPGDYTRFTVVIWIEGNDPDTTDAIIGGKFKVAMAISVVEEDGTPVEAENP